MFFVFFFVFQQKQKHGVCFVLATYSEREVCPAVWFICSVLLPWIKFISSIQKLSVGNGFLAGVGLYVPPSLLYAGVLSGLSLSRSYACSPVSVISKVTCCLWKMLFPESHPQPLALMSFLTCRSHRFPKPWGEGCDKDSIILSVWVPRCVQQKWPRLFRKIILQKHLEILQKLQEKKKRIREKQEWERWDLPKQWACPLLLCLAFPWTSCCHSWNLALSCAQIILHCSLFDCCISHCPQTCV